MELCRRCLLCGRSEFEMTKEREFLTREVFRVTVTLEMTLQKLWESLFVPSYDLGDVYKAFGKEEGNVYCSTCLGVLHEGLRVTGKLLELEERLRSLGGKIGETVRHAGEMQLEMNKEEKAMWDKFQVFVVENYESNVLPVLNSIQARNRNKSVDEKITEEDVPEGRELEEAVVGESEDVGGNASEISLVGLLLEACELNEVVGESEDAGVGGDPGDASLMSQVELLKASGDSERRRDNDSKKSSTKMEVSKYVEELKEMVGESEDVGSDPGDAGEISQVGLLLEASEGSKCISGEADESSTKMDVTKDVEEGGELKVASESEDTDEDGSDSSSSQQTSTTDSESSDEDDESYKSSTTMEVGSDKSVNVPLSTTTADSATGLFDNIDKCSSSSPADQFGIINASSVFAVKSKPCLSLGDGSAEVFAVKSKPSVVDDEVFAVKSKPQLSLDDDVEAVENMEVEVEQQRSEELTFFKDDECVLVVGETFATTNFEGELKDLYSTADVLVKMRLNQNQTYLGEDCLNNNDEDINDTEDEESSDSSTSSSTSSVEEYSDEHSLVVRNHVPEPSYQLKDIVLSCPEKSCPVKFQASHALIHLDRQEQEDIRPWRFMKCLQEYLSLHVIGDHDLSETCQVEKAMPYGSRLLERCTRLFDYDELVFQCTRCEYFRHRPRVSSIVSGSPYVLSRFHFLRHFYDTHLKHLVKTDVLR